MPLIDDLKEPLTDQQLERRKLLAVIGSGALTTATLGTAVTAVRYLSPGVVYEAASKFKAAPLESIAIGGVLAFPQKKVYVLRNEAGLYALSATCTHLGCMTRFESENRRLFCPCHGSQFDLEGKVMGGPAPAPLPRLKVTVDKGVVLVDTKELALAGEILKV